MNNSIKLIERQKVCYLINHDRIKLYKKENGEKNIDQNKKYIKQRRRTDINYRRNLITRSTIHQALQRKTKSFLTKDILVTDFDL